MIRILRRTAAIGLFIAAGCSQPPVSIVDIPLLEMNPSGLTPLSGLLTFVTDQAARPTLRIIDDEGNELTATPSDAFVTEHEVMVLGLRPDRTNTIELSLENESGLVAPALAIDVETKPLPDIVPPITVNVSRSARMEPGVTFLPVADNDDGTVGFLVALDSQGDVIWYYDSRPDEPRRLRNGNILMQDDFVERRRLIEIDMLGRKVREWYATGVVDDPPEGAIPVATDTFHHDVLEMPSGHFLAISTEIRHNEAYPTSDTDLSAPRVPQDIIVDRIVEFIPETGEIVRDWSLFDLIDPNRIGQSYDATDFYSDAYDDIVDEPLVDWTHANGLIYDEAADTLILSIRKMSAVVKIDLAANELLWILGDPTGWGQDWQDLVLEPDGEVSWPYGQHAPELLPTGSMLLFDNGSWGRSYPPNEPAPIEERYSRAVEYLVDEENMAVKELWAYGSLETDRFYSSFASEADHLPLTGNILIVSGGQQVDDASNPVYVGYESDTPPRVSVSVKEVSHDDPSEKFWDIEIDTLDRGWWAYRVERLPSLYP